VLGRSEFKQLLRWRLGLRRDLKSLLGGGAAAEEDAKKGSHKKQQQQQQQDGQGDEEEGGEQEDAETKLLAEMEAIKDAAEKR
jgi:AdoMet-dependent rRNA methyltransferase SPB1